MFTGIVTGMGTIREIVPIGNGEDMRITVEAPWPDTGSIALGASIACAGCCLTAIAVEPDRFVVNASSETLSRTTLGAWRVGSRINLERALKLGDELGGHIVAGHVDGVGRVVSAEPEHGSTRWRFAVTDALARFIAPKGSVAVDGVSLTVNEVIDVAGAGAIFGVNIIPHTAAVTTFGTLAPGDAVNIEIDTLARYVARLNEAPRLEAT
ncbi:MAG TPA: riboflavin synthase [Acetobacteraceae bacterium]|jgi:riboflavin synthase